MSKDNLISNDDYANTDQIPGFVKTNSEYYIHEFGRINNSSKFVVSFNLFAFLFGSACFGVEIYGTGL